MVYRPGNDFELIPAVEMETRNPIAGYFGSESVIIAPEIVRQIFKRFFLRFFRITTNYSKVFKILFRKFSSRH